MNQPAVTIVTPTYRRLPYLRQAVESALRQSFTDFELIVSDDDASPEVEHYVATLGDPRLRYRSNQPRLGIALNNYAAFCEARGKYIASLHDDDLWEAGFLQALVAPLEADAEISVCFCDHHIIDGEGRFLQAVEDRNTRLFYRDRLKPGRHQPFIREAAIDLSIPMVMGAVFRRSILQGAEYPWRIGGSYDHWLSYLAVRDNQAVFYVPERLTRYRIHAGSGTYSQWTRNLRNAVYVRKKFLGDRRLAGFQRDLRNGLGMLYGKLAVHFLARSSTWRAKILLQRALSLLNNPKNIMALLVNIARASLNRKHKTKRLP